jgi:hypothetical protein
MFIQVVGDICYQKRIKDMKIGDVGWVVPWVYDPKRNTINKHSTVHTEPGGTVEMKIEATRLGYRIYIPKDYKY